MDIYSKTSANLILHILEAINKPYLHYNMTSSNITAMTMQKNIIINSLTKRDYTSTQLQTTLLKNERMDRSQSWPSKVEDNLLKYCFD